MKVSHARAWRLTDGKWSSAIVDRPTDPPLFTAGYGNPVTGEWEGHRGLSLYETPRGFLVEWCASPERTVMLTAASFGDALSLVERLLPIVSNSVWLDLLDRVREEVEAGGELLSLSGRLARALWKAGEDGAALFEAQERTFERRAATAEA